MGDARWKFCPGFAESRCCEKITLVKIERPGSWPGLDAFEAIELSARHNISSLLKLVDQSEEKLRSALLNIQTERLKNLRSGLDESLQKWRERFPNTNWEALTAAVVGHGPRPAFNYLLSRFQPSREYVEISHREKLLNAIDFELFTRAETEDKFTDESAPSAAAPQRKFSATIKSLSAAKKVEEYLHGKQIGLTEFANRINVTDRTLRSFRKSGRIRRDSFAAIAKEMGTTPDELMKP